MSFGPRSIEELREVERRLSPDASEETIERLAQSAAAYERHAARDGNDVLRPGETPGDLIRRGRGEPDSEVGAD